MTDAPQCRQLFAHARCHRHPIAICSTMMSPCGLTQRGGARADAIACLLVVAVMVAGILAPLGLLAWEATQPDAVIAEGSAGAFTSATSSPGGFIVPTLTSVQTTAGTITVLGTFSALRGSPLIVRVRSKSNALQLCVTGVPDTCTSLAGAWPGILAATPQAAHVFAFARHGLSTDHLETWILSGVLATLLAIIIGALITTALDERTSDPASSP